MHVLIIPSEKYLPESSPLSGIFQRDQALALKNHGHEIGIISPHLMSTRLLEMLKTRLNRSFFGLDIRDEDGIHVYRKFGWVWERFNSHFRQKWINTGLQVFEKYCKDYGMPDIVHAHNVLDAGLLAYQIKMRHKVPAIVTEHSTIFEIGNIPETTNLQIEESYSGLDSLIVVSPQLGETLRRKYKGVSSYTWIPNIVGGNFEHNFHCFQARSLTKKQEEICFLAIANLEPHKGFSTLIEAFAKALEQNPKAKLLIGGSGPERHNLEKLSENLGISDKVRLLGYLDRSQVQQEMMACDIFVLPSFYETFGVVLIEALACGKPVIATVCGGPECIVHKNNGILVAPQNIDRLADAMILIARNLEKFSAQEIRSDCINRFGQQQFSKQLTDVYTQVIATYS